MHGIALRIKLLYQVYVADILHKINMHIYKIFLENWLNVFSFMTFFKMQKTLLKFQSPKLRHVNLWLKLKKHS